MNHNEFLISKSAFAENGYIWMLTEQTEMLCCIDIQKREIKKCFIIPGKRTEEISDIIMKNTNESIFFSSCNDKRLFRFVKGKRTFVNIFETISIEKKFKKGLHELIGAYDDCLVFFLKESESIVFLDVNTGNYHEDYVIFQRLKENGAEINGQIFSGGCFQEENKLYIPINEQNFLLMFNISEQSYNIYQLSKDINYKLSTIDRDILNGDFLLTTKDNQAIIWNPDEGIKSVTKLKNSNENNTYRDAFRISGRNYFIPLYRRKIYTEMLGKVEEMEFDYPNVEDKFRENIYEQYRAIFKYEKYVYFQARTNGQMYFIDTDNNMIQEYNVEITHEEKANYIAESYRKRGKPEIYIEDYDFALADYFRVVLE